MTKAAQTNETIETETQTAAQTSETIETEIEAQTAGMTQGVETTNATTATTATTATNVTIVTTEAPVHFDV